MAKVKNTNKNLCWRGCGLRGTPSLLVGMQTCTTTLKISMVVSQKIGNQPISGPSNTTLEHVPKGCSIILKNIYSTVFIAALFIITRTWKQPRRPSTEEWIKKMWYIYTMEYYSAIKNNDVVKFTGKWMEVEKNHSE